MPESIARAVLAVLERRIAAHVIVPFNHLRRVLISSHAKCVFGVSAEVIVDSTALNANERIGGSY